LARPCAGNGPLRAVGCLEQQVPLACTFTGRGRLPSPLMTNGWDRLSTAFRYYATIRLLSSHHHLVFRSSMASAHRTGAERSPRVSTQNFVPTPSPIRPPARRIWASLPLASSPAGLDASAALRFRSVRYCIIRLLPDAPSRAARTRRPCLVDGGFPPSGPQEDLTTTCLTSLFCVHAEHTNALRSASTRPSAGPSGIDDASARHVFSNYAMVGNLSITRRRLTRESRRRMLTSSRRCRMALPPFAYTAYGARIRPAPTGHGIERTPPKNRRVMHDDQEWFVGVD